MGERKNLPSASALESYIACPGKFLAEQGLPSESSEVALTGERIHAALEGKLQPDQLLADEYSVYEELLIKKTETISAVFGDEKPMEFAEIRYWLKSDGASVFSGRVDLVCVGQNKVLFLDYKTGFGDVTPASDNWQIRGLIAAYVSENGPDYACLYVGAIIQQGRAVSVVKYDGAEADSLYGQVAMIAKSVMQPGKERKPGDHCKYCRAKNICPELRATLAITINKPLEAVTNSDLSTLLDKCDQAEMLICSIKAEAKNRLTAGYKIPGYELKPGRTMEDIINPQLVFSRAIQSGVSQEAFMNCVKLNKGGLKEVLKQATGTNGKSLEAKLKAVLDGATSERQAAPSLTKI